MLTFSIDFQKLIRQPVLMIAFGRVMGGGVAVLIPNFIKFFNEKSVSNDSLECLSVRFIFDNDILCFWLFCIDRRLSTNELVCTIAFV